MNKYLIIFILLFSIQTSFAQEEEETNILTIEFKKYEEGERNVVLFGKQGFVKGAFIVKQGSKILGTHNFDVIVKKEEIALITVRDSKRNKLSPDIFYDANKEVLRYYENYTQNILGEETLANTVNRMEKVLSGLLYWARLWHKI